MSHLEEFLSWNSEGTLQLNDAATLLEAWKRVCARRWLGALSAT